MQIRHHNDGTAIQQHLRHQQPFFVLVTYDLFTMKFDDENITIVIN
jgi:hypothetical protein